MKSRRKLQGQWIETIAYLIPSLCLLWASAVYSQGLPKIPIYVKGREIRVEVAKTEEERSRGLMERASLGKDEGMLFIFEAEGIHGFWMKNTLLPLSIAFIDKEGNIVQITDMEPRTLSVHDPPKPVLYALEMNRGWFATNRIKAGDIMRFSK